MSEDCPFKIGDKVQIIAGPLVNEFGVVRFIGAVTGKDATFVGVELDEAHGKHDGEVKGVRYFKTAEKHGYMAPYSKLQHVQQNKISLNWDNKVQLIVSHWFRTELTDVDESELEQTTLDSEQLALIISYTQLLRYQFVYGIGNNEYGELGQSDIEQRPKFTKIKVKDIERVYGSDGSFFMVRGDEQNNHILSAGNNNWCQLGLGRGNHRTIMKFSKSKAFTNILYISRGLNATHTFFVMKNNDLYACGNNTMNQLAIAHNGNVVQEKPKALPLKKTPFAKDHVLDIKCGLMHTLFLTAKGKVYGIGGNEDAQIGLGKKRTGESQEIDKITQIKLGAPCKAIECGMNASFALTADKGVVFSWGKNTDAILGLKKKMDRRKVVFKPTPLDYLAEKGVVIEDLVCGAKHILAKDAEGRLFAWGSNKLGQCGIGKEKPEFVATAQKVKFDKSVREWRVGSYHSFIKCGESEWYSFGSNAFRQCILGGDEFDERVLAPTPIDESLLPKKCNVANLEIACGRETTIVLF